ncbi:hypothetical protein AeNC1_018153 [Aphanomyces euteiches]|nr:hypothetical protein AeNC1_018153 [Aphanomyces euteiches]
MVQITFRFFVATAYMTAVAVANIFVCPSSLSPCFVKSLNGTATTPVEIVSSGDINASKMDITTIECTRLQASSLIRLNLSYNALSSMENLLCLPSSLQVLDVSYNQLTAMENINWNSFPNLTTL